MPGALHFKLVIGEWEALVLNGAVQCKPLCPPPAPHPVTAGSRSLLPQELDGDGDGAVSLARKAASAETHEQGTPPPSLGDVGTPAAVKQGPDSCLLPSLKRRWGEGSAWLVCEKEMPARGGL